MRDTWLLVVVLTVAVAAGMWNSGPAPTAKAETAPEMGAMGAMGGASMTTAGHEGDACCPTDGAAAATHDCAEHEGEACAEHGAAAEIGDPHGAHGTEGAGMLTPEQMSAGVCPMGSGAPAPAADADPHAAHEGHAGHEAH